MTLKGHKTWTGGGACVLLLAFVLASASEQCPPLVCQCQGTSVDCSGSELTILPPGLHPSTRHLDLSRNNLNILNSTEILGLLTALETLDLSRNGLDEFRFAGSHYALRKLDLSGNNLTSVRRLRLHGLVGLQELNLADNKLMSLPAKGFKPVGATLNVLNLKSNKILDLDRGCFDGLQALEELTLSKNKISSFPKGFVLRTETAPSAGHEQEQV